MSMMFRSLSRGTPFLGLIKSAFPGKMLSDEVLRASTVSRYNLTDDQKQCQWMQKRFLRGGWRRPPSRTTDDDRPPSDSDSSEDEKKKPRTSASEKPKSRFPIRNEQEGRTVDQRFSADPKLKASRIREMLHNATTGAPDRFEVGSSVDPTHVRLRHQVDRRDQSRHALRPAIDPTQTSVLLFPGQGSQFVGMGKQLLRYPNVNRMFEMASQILGYDLKDVCINGPKLDLDRTIYCQPAVVVTSLAAVEKLKDEMPHVVDNCVATAGFSVGEITALIFAGVLSFEDGIKLVRIRAEVMQAASEENPGGMITVFYGADARIGFACSAAMEWCRKRGIQSPVCAVANYLFPGCKVIAGDEEALRFIVMNAKDFGILRHKRLPVSGAFHTLMMSPAKLALQEAMKQVKVRAPMVSVHSNVDGKRYRNFDHIRQQLPRQICQPVRWEQTMHVLYERPVGSNFPRTYECGPGKSLRTILQKVNVKAYDYCEQVEV